MSSFAHPVAFDKPDVKFNTKPSESFTEQGACYFSSFSFCVRVTNTGNTFLNIN